MIRRRRRAPWVEVMPAWQLAEGDLIVNGYRVTSLHREAVTRTVRVATTEPAVAELPHDAVVPVVRR